MNVPQKPKGKLSTRMRECLMSPIQRYVFTFRRVSGKQIIGLIMVSMGFALLISPTPPISTAAYIRDVLHIPLFAYAGALIICGTAITTTGKMNDTLDFLLTLPFLFWCGAVVGTTIHNNGAYTGAVGFIGLYILSLKVTGDE